MATNNENTEIDEEDYDEDEDESEEDEVENKEEDCDQVYGYSSVMRTKLVMAAGGSHWWNYIIEYKMEPRLHDYEKEEEGDPFSWDIITNKPHPMPYKERHTVFIENKHGITKCINKKLIWNRILGWVRLVDSMYDIPNDEEEEYTGQSWNTRY